jgi:hypothetical protein
MVQFNEHNSRLVQLRYKVLLDYSIGLRVKHEHIYALYTAAHIQDAAGISSRQIALGNHWDGLDDWVGHGRDGIFRLAWRLDLAFRVLHIYIQRAYSTLGDER